MRSVLLGLILVDAIACSDSTPAADGRPPEASIVDRALAERSADRSGGEARADLKPDGPRVPAHWMTVPGASLSMQNHTVTLLQNGEALIVGGLNQKPGSTTYTYLRKTYRYSPATDTIVEAGELAAPRGDHSATLLADGRVLVTSGSNDTTTYLVATEIFDPKQPPATAWSAGPTLPEGRLGASAILLPNGEVMLSGGAEGSSDSLDTVQFYKPGASGWKLSAGLLKAKRRYHASTLLPSDKLLLSGGASGQAGFPNAVYLSSLEVYDLKNGSSTLLTATMSRQRTFHSATVLDDGRVLIVGGSCGANCSGNFMDDLYDPKTDTITPVAHPGAYPALHLAVKLLDGRVLIAGNDLGAKHLVVAFDPKPSSLGWDTLPNIPHPRDRAQGVTLKDGSVLVVGGVAVESPFTHAAEVERFFP